MTINFDCLYFLDTQQLCIIEIKLTDFSEDVLPKSHYKWLMINKNTLEVKELQFKSMDSSNAIEERFFDLGYLKFDAEKGVYISKDPSAQYPLENAQCDEVPDSIKEAISNYLAS